jgi:hypothetical protein
MLGLLLSDAVNFRGFFGHRAVRTNQKFRFVANLTLEYQHNTEANYSWCPLCVKQASGFCINHHIVIR